MDPTPLPVSEAVSPSSLPQATTNPERRKTARTTPEGLVYISFESDNGGIISNVSEGGLCFSAAAPMQQTGKIAVWFSAGGHKIEAECEVAWTDETRRTGGLRFSGLSAAAREQIRNWTKPAGADRQRAFPVLSALRADTNALPEGLPRLEVLSPAVRKYGRLGAFSRGLVTGVLLSTIVGGALLFHAYRRQFGEALIRLGEHFGGKPQLQTASQAPAQILVPPAATRPQSQRVATAPAPTPVPPQATKPQLQTVSPASAPVMVPAPATKSQLQTVLPVPAPIPVPAHEKLQSPPVTEAVKSQPPKLESAAPANAVSAPATSLPTTPNAATSSPIANSPGELGQPVSAPSTGDIHVQQLEPGKPPGGNPLDFVELGAGIPLGKYFGLGRFTDKLGANKAADRLAQAGFHAMVVQKARLWIKSYDVLVGPYRNEHDAEAARRNLKASGFTPRTLKRKSRSLTLLSWRSRFDRTFFPIGDVVVSWEPYSPDAIVRFVKSSVVVTTVQGKWVNRHAPYEYDAIVYRWAGHGSRTLLEIQFSGASQTLVLADITRQIVF